MFLAGLSLPMITIFLLASVIAIILSRGHLSHRLRVFARGAGRDTLLLMIWIFILAGAFANSAKEMGSIADMVNLTLAIVPSSAILAGLFLGATVISLSIGTSVGTIVAMMPIAVGIAQQLEESVPFVAAIIIGGAFFGGCCGFCAFALFRRRLHGYLDFAVAVYIAAGYLLISH